VSLRRFFVFGLFQVSGLFKGGLGQKWVGSEFLNKKL
jgi:hypothetical protein